MAAEIAVRRWTKDGAASQIADAAYPYDVSDEVHDANERSLASATEFDENVYVKILE